MWPVSHPVVHPAPAPAPAEAEAPAAPAQAAAAPAPAPAQGQEGNAGAPPGVMMWAPTGERLGLRLAQALLAAAALAAMASVNGFAPVTGFRYLVSAAALQCLWSLALALLYFYALLVGRSYRTLRAIAILCAGDWATGALTLSAACASAGVTTFIDNDLQACYENPCPRLMAATAMAFLSWSTVAPGCVLNLGSLVHKLQTP